MRGMEMLPAGRQNQCCGVAGKNFRPMMDSRSLAGVIGAGETIHRPGVCQVVREVSLHASITSPRIPYGNSIAYLPAFYGDNTLKKLSSGRQRM